MRIDQTLPLTLTPLAAGAPQAGQGPLFEDLLTARGKTMALEAAAPRQRLFGFDALGVLGMGSPGQGQTQTRLPARPVTQKPGPIPAITATASALPPCPLAACETEGGVIHEGDANLQHVAGQGWQPGNRTAPFAVRVLPDGAAMAAPPRPVLSPVMDSRVATARVLRSLAPIEAVRDPEATGARPRAVRPSIPETASGRVSVAVSETDGILQVVVAADIADDDRQRLRDLARDAAHDVGRPLGAVTLNGRSLPESVPLTRSFPWPSQP